MFLRKLPHNISDRDSDKDCSRPKGTLFSMKNYNSASSTTDSDLDTKPTPDSDLDSKDSVSETDSHHTVEPEKHNFLKTLSKISDEDIYTETYIFVKEYPFYPFICLTNNDEPINSSIALQYCLDTVNFPKSQFDKDWKEYYHYVGQAIQILGPRPNSPCPIVTKKYS